MAENSPEEAKGILAGVPVGVVGTWAASPGRNRVSTRIAEHLTRAGAVVHGRHEGPLPETAPKPFKSWTGGPTNDSSFLVWLRDHGIRALVLNEYDEYPSPAQEKRLELALEEGVVCFAYLSWHRVTLDSRPRLRAYGAILSAHQTMRSFLEDGDVEVIPFAWGWRPPLPKPALSSEERLELLHWAGVGEDHYRKGTDRVTEAFSELAGSAGFACRIVTRETEEESGSERSRRYREAESCGVEVERGLLPHARVDAYNRRARVTVQPYRWEGLGLGLVESLSAGTPVVTVNGAPMTEYIRHKREGLLVPARSVPKEGTAAAICEFDTQELLATLSLLENRDLLRTLEKQAMAGGPARVDPVEAAVALCQGIRERLA